MTQAVNPAAFCPEHGLFSTGLLSVGGGVTFIGCRTTCPICCRACEILPGTYEASADKQLKLLLHPSVSREALLALRAIATAAQANEISSAEAQAKAEQIVKGSGRLFDFENWGDQAKATIYASIIGATALLIAARMSSSPTTTVLVQPVVERVVPGHESTLEEYLRKQGAVVVPKKKKKQRRK